MLELEKNILLNTLEGSSSGINCCPRASEHVYSLLLTFTLDSEVGGRISENITSCIVLNREESSTAECHRFELYPFCFINGSWRRHWAERRCSPHWKCGMVHVRSGNQTKPVVVSQSSELRWKTAGSRLGSVSVQQCHLTSQPSSISVFSCTNKPKTDTDRG